MTWREAYTLFAKNINYRASGYTPEVDIGMSLAYIDDDDIPELVFNDHSWEDYKGVYTFKNSELVKLIDEGLSYYQPRSGRFMVFGYSADEHIYYQLENGKVTIGEQTEFDDTWDCPIYYGYKEMLDCIQSGEAPIFPHNLG